MYELKKVSHPTEGMLASEKIERCRSWMPGGKFLHEPGSTYTPKPESILDIYRRQRSNDRSPGIGA